MTLYLELIIFHNNLNGNVYGQVYNGRNMPEYGLSLTRILSYKDRESTILFLYVRIRVTENPYSRIFYAVYS